MEEDRRAFKILTGKPIGILPHYYFPSKDLKLYITKEEDK
jgi:hypothetical protein